MVRRLARVALTQTMFGFTGEPTDGNGLVHLRARYYSPPMGVFTTLDPIENSNRYQYVRSNPLNRTDLLGLFDWFSCKLDSSGIYNCQVEEGDTLNGIA